MAIHFNITLPDNFLDHVVDDDERWIATKTFIKAYKALMEKQVPGIEVDIEW